ncbi:MULTISPECIES: dimethylarginine dimethylaminohydrolase family protein [unclassified Cupriavidus]|uniref:dimethylarginine dimethylaminohydrolase family protein n=1 Tax=unclassified Cupriavidus TaxID=2640874 RepID=UPI00088344F6|nr:arginine deiminase-related protein [Cupriavidus sp. YR651]SDC49759.1 N-Dimethylarginine dimethylaminohydrolase [Cupriavidus sp. YR651]
MTDRPTILLVAPTFYDVSYSINPWMDPDAWARDPRGMHRHAMTSFQALRDALDASGFAVEVADGAPGQPDMVFPANAAVVLDGKAVLARFRYPQRRGEEAPFEAIFEGLRARGLIDSVVTLPEGCFQEGAGDCIWDVQRGHFWAGFGPRSSREAADAMSSHFGQEVVALELATAQSYHLDVCFCPLAGGEVLYYPPAFSEASLQVIRARVPAGLRIEASVDDLRHFSVNAVNLDDHVVMTSTTPHLRAELGQRGYRLHEVDLSPFMLSGGGAYCMTLRLDRSSMAARRAVAA